jgi:hypothetical protein
MEFNIKNSSNIFNVLDEEMEGNISQSIPFNSISMDKGIKYLGFI